MTQCIVRYRCVVCKVSNQLTVDLMQLERNRSISVQLHEAVWDMHKRYDGVTCGAVELVCGDTDSALRDVRFVFLPQPGLFGKLRERAIQDALAEMDWERDGQYQADRIIASAR